MTGKKVWNQEIEFVEELYMLCAYGFKMSLVRDYETNKTLSV